MYKDLAFNNSPSGMYWNKVTQEDSYSVISNNNLTALSFTNVLESEWLIVLNWPYNMHEVAVDIHDVENRTLLGMEIELSQNADIVNFDYEDKDMHVADLTNFEITCDAVRKVPFYHSMNSHIKEIAKYEGYLSVNTKACIDRALNNLLGIAVNSARNELNESIVIAG